MLIPLSLLKKDVPVGGSGGAEPDPQLRTVSRLGAAHVERMRLCVGEIQLPTSPLLRPSSAADRLLVAMLSLSCSGSMASRRPSGAVQALDDVSVECRAGEIHALVGENGWGKSTLLGVASGFVTPDHGDVEIGGNWCGVASPPPRRDASASGWRTRPTRTCSDLSVAENLYLAAPGDVRAGVPAHGGMGEMF